MLNVTKDFMFEFADELTPNADDNKQDPAAQDTNNHKDDNSPNAGDKDKMIPKSRFDEVNNKYKEMQKQLDALLADKKKADDEKAKADKKAKEEAGKFEELYKTTAGELDKFKGESETAKTRIGELEAVINGLLEAKLAGIPEEFHDLIPSNLTPEAKLAWVTTAEGKGLFGSAQQKKNEPVGKVTNPNQQQTTDLNSLSPIELLRAGYGSK